MKQVILLSHFLIFSFSHGIAQVLEPVIWHSQPSKKEVLIGDTLDLIFFVDIQKGWYLYSTDFDPELGPMVTEFNFLADGSYELIGGVKPLGAKKKYDELWEGEYTYFTKKAEFRQTIKVLNRNLLIKGSYAYQVCTTVDGKCIPFYDEFEFSGFTVNGQEGKQTKESTETASNPEIKTDNKVTSDTATATGPVAVSNKKPLLLHGASDGPYSLFGFMVLAFLGGLAALFTPCVFPMIPMTVTFFTTQNKNRKIAVTKASIYGISILLIYVFAGTVVAMVNGPGFANWLSTHWLPNVFFFIVFLIFGLSFLGLFEITLPSSFVNKVDRESDKGGYYGVFFMAFTLVLVSFSCTGPIVGSILVESAGGMVLKPVLGMFAFALAFAVPFTLFAIFPEWLNNLPKSGGWLNSLKVSLGFLELALGLKFLSIADQVYHWGILDREIYLVLWIVIFFFLGLYLLGKVRLSHDSKMETIGVTRLLLAVVVFSFTLYLVPGLFGAPLKALAGYLPPMSTQDFNIASIIREQNSSSYVDEISVLCDEPKYNELLELPHGLKGYFDYEQALACAKEQNKPLFIDFTGHGCVNCREMEARVWSDPEVLHRLKNEYVIVALYVDEKTELPEPEWYTSSYDGKIKKTIGKQNADIQITRFNNNAQPYYVILDPYTERMLVEPKAYDLDIAQFLKFLKAGKTAFNANSKKVNEL